MSLKNIYFYGIEYFGFRSAVWHSKVTKKRKKIIWSGLANKKINIQVISTSEIKISVLINKKDAKNGKVKIT